VSSTLNINELLNYYFSKLFIDNDLIINQLKKNHKLYWFIPVDGPQIFCFNVLMLRISK